MNRQKLEKLIAKYQAVLRESALNTEFTSSKFEYYHHLSVAEEFFSDFQAGNSEELLKTKLKNEILQYQLAYLPGGEAEDVGRAFGNLCRAISVRFDLGEN